MKAHVQEKLEAFLPRIGEFIDGKITALGSKSWVMEQIDAKAARLDGVSATASGDSALTPCPEALPCSST